MIELIGISVMESMCPFFEEHLIYSYEDINHDVLGVT